MARPQWIPYVETDRDAARRIGALLRRRGRRFRYVAGAAGLVVVEYWVRANEWRNDADPAQ